MIKYIFLSFCIFIVVISCKQKSSNSNDVLEVKEMVPVMFDLQAAGDLIYNDTAKATRLHLRDSVTDKFQSILKYYHLNKKQFYSSMEYYENNPEKELVLIDSLQSYSSNILQKLEKAKNKKDSLERVKNQPKIDTTHKPKKLEKLDAIHKLDTSKTVVPGKLLKLPAGKLDLKKVK
jgi:hypothetical protein